MIKLLLTPESIRSELESAAISFSMSDAHSIDDSCTVDSLGHCWDPQLIHLYPSQNPHQHHNQMECLCQEQEGHWTAHTHSIIHPYLDFQY